ncbi:hypothetical protein GCM10027186_34990 [Micromonospora schwarzwaldensis]
MRAVGLKAERLGRLVGEDAQLLAAAGWLHDVGYAPAVADTGFHALDGARWLLRQGFPPRLAGLVAHHSCASYEAEVRGMKPDLMAEFPFEESPTSDALWYADMTTGPGFGPTTVMLARAHTALDLGAGHDAVAWHEKACTRDGWRWLAAEHRAGHLVQAARAYLQIDQPARAGRALADAAHLAPDELRHRPHARAVLSEVVRSPHAPVTVIQLAATLGVT